MILYQGDCWPAFSFEVKDENGNAFSAYTPVAQLKRQMSDAEPVMELTDSDGFIKDGNTTTFDSSRAISLPAGRYYWDVEARTEGAPITLYSGIITIIKGVTE